jgi:F0F1-type ATP synthase membrane subunit c/vacuolar-type H+-ATPase subunit K
VIVDASGLGGAGLLPVTTPSREDLCAAAQGVYDLVDPQGGSAFMDRHGVAPGETLCFTGIAGGYSILNVRISGDEVSILTGSIPALGHPSGKALLDDFVAREGWIGERRFGGSRAIPLARPVDRLVDEGVALLGDAARQVFTVHGSGIGMGLLAARLLSHVLEEGQPLESYSLRWMRSYGALQATYEVFRRFSATLEPEELVALVECGLMTPETAAPTMAQRWPSAPPKTWPKMVRGVARQPRLAARLGAVFAKMSAVRALYALYPREGKRVKAWSRQVERLLP